jgi:hypothetical protein
MGGRQQEMPEVDCRDPHCIWKHKYLEDLESWNTVEKAELHLYNVEGL